MWKRLLIVAVFVCLLVEVRADNDWPYYKSYVLSFISSNNIVDSNSITSLLNGGGSGSVTKHNGHTWTITFPNTTGMITNIVLTEGSSNYWSKTNAIGYLTIKTNYYSASSNNTFSISALWYAKGQNDVASGYGDNLVARDTGWWHLSVDGSVTPNTVETYPDFNWITNSLGELTPR